MQLAPQQVVVYKDTKSGILYQLDMLQSECKQ